MLPEGYEYGLADTPCEPIAQRDVISYPAGAVERFPGDGFLVCHGLDARGPDARSRRGRRRLRLRDLPRARRRRRGRDRGAADLRRARDRIEALGGRLEIESAPGAGTRLRASIPLAPRRDEREPFIEFGYDGDGGAGERSIQQILDGSKTVSISIAREWELEGGAPRIGQKLPIVDSAGRRRATVEVTRVAVLPFGRLGEDVVAAESAGTAKLDEWLASHREFYAGCAGEIALLLEEPGWRLTDAEPMVVTSFRLARG
jgi:uncharacterized protein YhfF